MLTGLFGRKYPSVSTIGAGLYMSPKGVCSPDLMGDPGFAFQGVVYTSAMIKYVGIRWVLFTESQQ